MTVVIEDRSKINWTWSVSIHVGLILLLLLFVRVQDQFGTKAAESIEFEVVDNVNQVSKAKQVVISPKSQETDKANADSFLSDKNRIADREKSARVPGEPTIAGMPSQAFKVKPQSTTKDLQKPVTLSDLGLHIATQQPKKNYQADRNWAPTASGETMKGGEYIKGMEVGDSSVLNTKEFVFYSYFERVRRQLDQAWQPMLREQVMKIYRRGRKLSSEADYTTKTMVTLNNKGEIVRVRVLEQSGATDLDDVAIDALNRAGPYPNPPHGLVDASGKIEIRWDFILKT